jgi:hypothetical protein
VTGRGLLAWGDREERRRRRARAGPASLSPWVWSAAGGALLFAEVARRLGAFTGAEPALESASHTWLAACLAAHIIVFFGAPFRTYWRHDSALLARLPIPGAALFRLALLRSLRATARVLVPCAAGALAFGPFVAWEAALRHLALAAIAAAGAGLLAPAVALAAGAAVASDKADALMESFGGEFRAPRTTWLGALPGLGATAVAVALLAASPWALGGRAVGGEAVTFGLGLLVPLAAIAWALARADRIMRAALREVSALDQERLAHVDRSTPSRIERAWFGAVLGGPARLVAHKDASLSRRRYPSPYFLFPLGIAALWVLAAARPGDLLAWSAAILACLGAYAAVMARRLVSPPVEQPRLLRSLPIPPAAVVAAKRWQVALRVLLFSVAGGAPLVARAPDPAIAAAVVAAVAAASLAAGLVAASADARAG